MDEEKRCTHIGYYNKIVCNIQYAYNLVCIVNCYVYQNKSMKDCWSYTLDSDIVGQGTGGAILYGGELNNADSDFGGAFVSSKGFKKTYDPQFSLQPNERINFKYLPKNGFSECAFL